MLPFIDTRSIDISDDTNDDLMYSNLYIFRGRNCWVYKVLKYQQEQIWLL